MPVPRSKWREHRPAAEGSKDKSVASSRFEYAPEDFESGGRKVGTVAGRVQK